MNELLRQARRFREEKDEFEARARQTAAFYLVSGIDLDDALATTGTERRRIAAHIARLIERERLKGVRRHWSYDINRHIALKQALDRLSA
ncbi:MAG: cytoplasmic protein [Mesorhizobium sp.]|nr:cytoplasmic protein [Mesorhizobium sp.]MCO5159941.1 cytoplasmic protein [Mesorhizobium sp.]